MVTRKTIIIDRFVPDARQTAQSNHFRAEVRCLLLLPLIHLSLADPEKGNIFSSRPLPVREMPKPGLLPSHQEVSSSKNHQLRSGRTWHPPLEQHWRGSLHSNWMASLFLRVLVYGYGRKVKGVALPKAWCTVSFCPRTCTPLRKG